MRPSCLYCARKHLGQAEVLMSEALNGYPLHKWIAVGHIAEAEHELLLSQPDLVKEIREHRLSYMTDSNYNFPTLDLIQTIELLDSGDIIEEDNTEEVNNEPVQFTDEK